MLKNSRYVILVLILFGDYLSALEPNQADFRCDLLLGDWSGVYEQEGGRSYRFDSALDEDGSILVDFDYFETGETDRHEGYWLCENGILTTGMITEGGGSILYHYQIIDIDRQTMTYRMISPAGMFDTFRSTRVGARPMKPELLDP